MGFVAVLAFCVMTSAGPQMPSPPYECIFVENSEFTFQTQTACVIQAMRLGNDPILRLSAEKALTEQYGPQQRITWYSWCHAEEDLKDFYRHFGVGDLGDIPEDV